MVKPNSPPLDRVFAALADPSRRTMVERLEGGNCTVGELAEMFDFSLPAVSKHLRVLERAGLLIQTRQGRARLCRLNRESLGEATRWLATRRRQGIGQEPAVEPLPLPPPAQVGVSLPEFD